MKKLYCSPKLTSSMFHFLTLRSFHSRTFFTMLPSSRPTHSPSCPWRYTLHLLNTSVFSASLQPDMATFQDSPWTHQKPMHRDQSQKQNYKLFLWKRERKATTNLSRNDSGLRQCLQIFPSL